MHVNHALTKPCLQTTCCPTYALLAQNVLDHTKLTFKDKWKQIVLKSLTWIKQHKCWLFPLWLIVAVVQYYKLVWPLCTRLTLTDSNTSNHAELQSVPRRRQRTQTVNFWVCPCTWVIQKAHVDQLISLWILLLIPARLWTFDRLIAAVWLVITGVTVLKRRTDESTVSCHEPPSLPNQLPVCWRHPTSLTVESHVYY